MNPLEAARFAVRTRLSGIGEAELYPGTPQYIEGISYWVPDKEAGDEVVVGDDRLVSTLRLQASLSAVSFSVGGIVRRSRWTNSEPSRRDARAAWALRAASAELLKAAKRRARSCLSPAPGELALLVYEPVEPGDAGVAFRGAARVDVPVEGLAVVAEAAVQLADEVGGDGELAPDEGSSCKARMK